MRYAMRTIHRLRYFLADAWEEWRRSPGVNLLALGTLIAVLFLSGFEQRTIPRQMWAGIREQISPTILAVATILVLISVALLATIELLRRRNDRLRGIV